MFSKQGVIICLTLLLISFTSAIYLESGETTEVVLEKPFAYWGVVGNSSPVEIEVSLNETTAYITPSKYDSSDNYEIVFFDVEKEVINIYHSGGGGGGIRYRYVNQTEYVNQTIEKEVEVERLVAGDVTPPTILGKSSNYWSIVGLLIIGFLVGGITVYYYKKGKDKRKDMDLPAGVSYY